MLPIFWKQLAHVSTAELVLHRIVWSLAFVAVGVLATRRWPDVRRVVRDPTRLAWFVGSAVFIAINWTVFLYAVETNQLTQSSLGYYLNPLLNVLLGRFVLGERLNRTRWGAVGVAAIGVALLTLRTGGVPWIGLVLAGAFATYGLLRKRAPADALVGSAVEFGILAPLALVALLWIGPEGGFASGTIGTRALIVLTGPATAVPILCFSAAARRLPLSTLGFVQYLAPTLQLLVGVALYGEPFDRGRLAAFLCIWTACVVFSADLARGDIRRERTA